jgi:hypothetical protein
VRLIALVLIIAIVAASALGGHASRLAHTSVRGRWTAAAGLALQLLPLPPSLEALAVPILLLSLGMLVAFVCINLELRGFELILIGLLLNVVVIGVNGGMPVSRAALAASGQLDSLEYLEQHGGAKHHLAGRNDDVVWLGDVIAVPRPIGLAISVGDIVAYAGVGLFVSLSMLDRVKRSKASAVAATEVTA